MKTTDYSTLSTAALLKIRGRSKPGGEEDQAVERELKSRGEDPQISRRLDTRRGGRKTPLLFTATEWAQTQAREGP